MVTKAIIKNLWTPILGTTMTDYIMFHGDIKINKAEDMLFVKRFDNYHVLLVGAKYYYNKVPAQ